MAVKICPVCDREDKVEIIHGGSASEQTLTGVTEAAFFGTGSSGSRGIGGEPCMLELAGKGITLEAGDLVVRD